MKFKKIAITGGIGSGKSVALDILSTAGYKTLSSDKIVSQLYETRKVKKLLKSMFPNAVSGLINLKIDRKKISEIVFSNEEMHKKLTNTITPLVLEEIKRRTKNLSEHIFIEVPLLFECGYEKEFDAVMIITRPLKNRIESVKSRSKLTEEQIIARIKKQTDYDNKDLSAFTVIENDGDVPELKEKVLKIANAIIDKHDYNNGRKNMFYEKQPEEQKQQYKQMLEIIGKLTRLFSDNNCPYLPYRAQENIFCKYFRAENISRSDCSADAKKDNLGVGLKTWMGNNDQKVAEFDSLREQISPLSGIKLAKKVAKYRNERIRITKNLNGLSDLVYHIVKRVPNCMQIYEHAFEPIDIDNITLMPERGNKNNTYFTDGKNTYHFSKSKNTLYMLFNNMELLDAFSVDILDDPYSYLMSLAGKIPQTIVAPQQEFDTTNKACLRLYSTKSTGEKFIAKKSGLNQWNAGGRKRDINEIYIPFPAEDRRRYANFFPNRDQPFDLILPDGTKISAKICQDDNKAIMSNPNKELGEWLLRKVFELPEKTVLTYEMLKIFGIDCVVFTKLDELKYSVDFAELGTYEKFTQKELTEDEE